MLSCLYSIEFFQLQKIVLLCSVVFCCVRDFVFYIVICVNNLATNIHDQETSNVHSAIFFIAANRDAYVEHSLLNLLSSPLVGCPIPVTPDTEIVALMCSDSELLECQVSINKLSP